MRPLDTLLMPFRTNVPAQVELVDPVSDRRWDRFIEGWDASTVFHTSAWLAVIRDTYGFTIDALASVADGELRQAIAFARLKGRLVAMPFSDYWSLPIVDDATGWELMMITLSALTGDASLEVRGGGDFDYEGCGFERDSVFLRHRLILDRPYEQLEARFLPAARRAIRKAERGQLTIRRSVDMADMMRFYDLVVETRRKQKLLPQPRRFFEAIQRNLVDQGHGFLLLAEVDGRVIAGDLMLAHKRTLTYKFNASSTDFLHLRPNNLLMAGLIRVASAEGFEELDLGRCDLDADGLRRYKLMWGCEEDHYFYYTRPGRSPSKRHHDPIGRAIPILVPHVPRWMLRRAGDRLYRRFA